MSDIAQAAGVSRQVLYLHFASRAELLVATTRYGDQVLGSDERLRRWRAATSGVELLAEYIEFWGNYIPEIAGIARALLTVYETDEAAALAWNERIALYARVSEASGRSDLERQMQRLRDYAAERFYQEALEVTESSCFISF